MGDRDDLRDAVAQVLRDEGRAGDDLVVTPETPLTDGGFELTSLGLVRVLVGLEDRFDVELDDGAVMNASFQTVGDIVALVAESLDEARVGAR